MDAFRNRRTNLSGLARFAPKAGSLYFQASTPYELPYINRYKFYENYFGSTMCQYPILAFPYVNQLYNTETKESVDLMDNTQYVAKVHKSGLEYTVGDNVKEAFEVIGLGLDYARKEVYTITRLNSAYFLHIHSLDLKLKKQVPLSITGLSKMDIADVDVYDGIIYLREYESLKYIALPLSLFK